MQFFANSRLSLGRGLKVPIFVGRERDVLIPRCACYAKIPQKLLGKKYGEKNDWPGLIISSNLRQKF
jgi:hypothetical protein